MVVPLERKLAVIRFAVDNPHASIRRIASVMEVARDTVKAILSEKDQLLNEYGHCKSYADDAKQRVYYSSYASRTKRRNQLE